MGLSEQKNTNIAVQGTRKPFVYMNYALLGYYSFFSLHINKQTIQINCSEKLLFAYICNCKINAAGGDMKLELDTGVNQMR